jgi:hypothetical protein
MTPTDHAAIRACVLSLQAAWRAAQRMRRALVRTSAIPLQPLYPIVAPSSTPMLPGAVTSNSLSRESGVNCRM